MNFDKASFEETLEKNVVGNASVVARVLLSVLSAVWIIRKEARRW